MSAWTQKRLYYNIILPFSSILENMEFYGCLIDTERMNALEFELSRELKRLESAIWEYTGEINLKSPKQLCEAIYGRMKFDNFVEDYKFELNMWIPYRDLFLTAKNAPSLDVNAVKKLREVHKHPVFDLLLEYRKTQKVLSTYIGNEKKGLRQYIFSDNRIRASYWQMTMGGRPRCIAKGSMIRMKGKYKKIEELEAGEEVACVDEKLFPRFSKIKWIKETGIKKVIRLHFTDYWHEFRTGNHYTLDLTPDHKIMLRGGHYIKAKDSLNYPLYGYDPTCTVCGIEELKEPAVVYDMEVEEHHNFFANDVCCKNCDSPNLLNIPSRALPGKKVKEFFLADEGCSIVRADYKAMELRGLAWMAHEDRMTAAFEKGENVHAITANSIFGIPYNQIVEERDGQYAKEYFCGKTVNFAIVYGGTYITLQNQLLNKGDLYFDKKKCHEFTEAFYDLYPRTVQLLKNVKQFILRKGYIKNLFGRKRDFSFLDHNDSNATDTAAREALSHLIQGSTSGDYSAFKCVKLQRYIDYKKLNARFYNVLYDGFYINIQDDQIEEFIPVMKKILETPEDPIEIKLPVDIKVGKRWSET